MTWSVLQQVESRIQAIILKQFEGYNCDITELAVSTPILGKGLGLDSLEAMALILEIEAEFAILFDDEDLTLELFENVGALANSVRRKLSDDTVMGL